MTYGDLMHALPDVLVERLRNRQAVLVLGAGCSEMARLPGWNALCERLLDFIEDETHRNAVLELLHQGHLTSALAGIHEMLDEETVNTVVADACLASPQIPDTLKAVGKAPWRGFIVTTFDALWAAVLADDAEVAQRSVLAANASSLEEGRGRFLLQLFGRADAPGTLCLAPAQVPARVGDAARVVANLYQKWSFVFLGFGPDDPDLFMLMHRVLGAAQTHAPHFLLAQHLSSDQDRTVRAELGLIPVELDASWDETMSALAEIGAQPGRKPGDEEAEAWLELFLADPADNETREGLDRSVAHLRAQQEWDRLVGILISRAEIISEPAEQASALHEVALLLEKEMGAPDRGYSVAMTALRLQPRDENLLADAKRMAQRGGQWDEFLREAAMLETQGTDADDSTQIALGMARVYARDGEQLDEAITSFQKVLARDPQNPEALAELENLYRRGERWPQLTAFYEKILARDPHNNAAFSKLEELYRQIEQWTPLTALLEKELARNPSDPAAFAKLEELYRKTEQNKPLVDLLRKAMARNPTDGSLFAKLEQIYRSTEQWKPLVDMFEALTARDPANQEALAKLEELYRRTEQWTLLCDLLEMRAQRKGDAEYARGLRMERASLLIDKLKDIDSAMVVAQGFAHEDAGAAEELYLKALNSDPENAVALAALADVCNRRGEYQRAAKFAQEGAERSKNPIEKGRLLAQAGLLLLDHLDNAQGQELLERALSVDPEQVMAAERMAELREARQEWVGLEPLLDMLLRRTPTEDKTTRARLHERLGRCARHLGKRDKALSHLRAASELSPDSLSLMQALADVNFEREDWAAAAETYERIGQLGKDKLSVAELVRICIRLAECAEHRADPEASLRYREEAASLEPHERAHLDTLVALRTSREEWEQVIELRRKLLSLISEVEERAQLWDAMGDIYRDKLKNADEAAACYGKALSIQPERRQTLYKVLDHYSARKEWASAVETLERLVSLETEPPMRARARYTLAAIYRDEVHEYAKAVVAFTQVLEDDPMFMKAFDAIERLLTESKNWKELARAYRRQLKRMPPEAPVEIKLRLWDALALVAIQHLKNRESATLALEVAAKLDYQNLARQEHLAQVYQQTGPSAAGKAIAQHQFLISKMPERIASYQALAPLFFQSGALDQMWCTAAALVHLGHADARMAAFYQNHRPQNLPMASGKMTENLWRTLVHPGEDAYLAALLSLLSPALAMASAVPHKAVGLDRAERVDLSSGAWAYAPVLQYVSNTIEAPLPDVFFKKDAPGTVSLVNLKDKNVLTPALVVGPGFAQWTQQSEIVFDITKRLALLRAERFARLALGTPAMVEIAVRAGLLLGGSPIGNGVHGEEVEKLARTLDPLLPANLRAELKPVTKRFVETHGADLDIPSWIVATDLTAARVALTLSGDVCTAARVLASEPSGQSPLSAHERINDLLAFSVSPEHFAVRTTLGLHVEIPMPQAPAPSPARRTSHAQMKAQP
jgi:tetratricopeptide (TPR) repeat protein